MIYTNIWELLYDMRINGSNDILCADSPSPPHYGWVCPKTEKEWKISIGNTMSSSKLGDSKSIAVLEKYFSTSAHRRQIVKLLDSLPFLEKLNKLKAFY